MKFINTHQPKSLKQHLNLITTNIHSLLIPLLLNTHLPKTTFPHTIPTNWLVSFKSPSWVLKRLINPFFLKPPIVNPSWSSPHMGSAPDIVDISSDEENTYDWISEILGRSDREPEGFGDVVVVDELSAPAAAQRRGALRDDSDDDCLVLDADLDKPVTVIDDKCGGGHGSDDLLIVGEKGAE